MSRISWSKGGTTQPVYATIIYSGEKARARRQRQWAASLGHIVEPQVRLLHMGTGTGRRLLVSVKVRCKGHGEFTRAKPQDRETPSCLGQSPVGKLKSPGYISPLYGEFTREVVGA